MAETDIQIDQATKEMLADLQKITSSLNAPMLLIGARARILAFDSQFTQGRATEDWDLAVEMDDWSRYEALVTQMTTGKPAQFRKTDVIHKFIHINTGLEVDIIPFGGISNEQQEITWSDGNQMSVLGLQEAFQNARIEQVDDIEIRVLDYPAIVGLKFLAWHERREIKDLADIIHVLENYQDDQRIEKLYPEIEKGQLGYASAPSALIGQDIQTIFQTDTLEKIREVLSRLITQQNQHIPQFIAKDLDGEDWDTAFEELVNRFEALQYGLQQVRDVES